MSDGFTGAGTRKECGTVQEVESDPKKLNTSCSPKELRTEVDKRLAKLSAGSVEVLEDGTYKGATYRVYKSEDKIYWEAANKNGTALSKAEGVSKAKKAIDELK